MAYAERHRKRWRAKFKTPAGWRKKSAPRGTTWTMKQAEAEAWRLQEAAFRGELPTMASDRLTLGELCEWWLENWCKDASYGREKSRLKANVLERSLAALPLPKVTPEIIEARLREMEATGAAPAAVEHVRRTLRTVFNRAIRAKLWSKNPAAEAHARSMDPVRETRPLTPDEVPRVISAILEPWKRDLVVAALFTGMRKGELLALSKEAIDLHAGTIRIARSHGRHSTKGGHSDTIPVAGPLRPFLEHAIQAAGDSDLVFPAPGGGRRPETTNAVAIIQKALRDAGLVSGWDHICRRCKGRGVQHSERLLERRHDLRCPHCGMRLWPKAIPRPFTFHGLRHTTASLLARAGVPIHILQRILRHRSIETTIKRYVHLYDGELREAFAKLPSVLPPEEIVAATTAAAAARADARAPAVPPALQIVKREGPEPVVETTESSGPSEWRAIQDSNLWPSAPEADALSS